MQCEADRPAAATAFQRPHGFLRLSLDWDVRSVLSELSARRPAMDARYRATIVYVAAEDCLLETGLSHSIQSISYRKATQRGRRTEHAISDDRRSCHGCLRGR